MKARTNSLIAGLCTGKKLRIIGFLSPLFIDFSSLLTRVYKLMIQRKRGLKFSTFSSLETHGKEPTLSYYGFFLTLLRA